MTEQVRIYINTHAIDVPPATTALDAIAAWDSSAASSIRAGERLITDSRGLPIPADSPVHNGAIFRIIRRRDGTADDTDFVEP